MAISSGDIRFLASQVMSDVDTGGGRPTATVIQDGASNSIFEDVSELDRVVGRVNLRKVFLSVDTPTRDTYLGANIIVGEPPSDPNVSCTLFTTNDGFDQRAQAQARLEAYVIAGPLSKLRLYGNQFVGQRALLVYQREEDALPVVGDVLVLSAENAAGVVSASQYVRITDISHAMQTFTDPSGDFKRRVLTLFTSDALAQTFIGAEPTRTSDTAPTRIRTTQVADTTQYFGTVGLAQAASVGDLTIHADSIFSRLVPSSTAEAAISLARIQGINTLLAASNTPVTRTIAPAGGTSVVGYADTPILPGSLTVTIGAYSATDDGAGKLAGTLIAADTTATVDYTSGLIQFTRVAAANGSTSATYTPAGSAVQASHTRNLPITIANRGTVWSLTLAPLPARGTLTVDYMSQGRWYQLVDNGSGNLSGADPSIGTGAVQYASGAVVITLGALPDVGSAIMLQWGSPAHTVQKAGAASGSQTSITLRRNLAHKPVVATSLTISWLSGGIQRTATTAANGTITGPNATGLLNAATGETTLNLTTAPDAGAQFVYTYSYSGPANGTDLVFKEVTSTLSGGAASLGEPLTPGSVVVSVDVGYGRARCKDDGAGNLVVVTQKVANETVTVQGSPLTGGAYSVVGAISIEEHIVGTVNYSSGVVTFTQPIQIQRYKYSPTFAVSA